MCTAHTVPDSNDRARHLLALNIDKVEEVPGMVKPAGC